jgi:hypothetical protein
MLPFLWATISFLQLQASKSSPIDEKLPNLVTLPLKMGRVNEL